ncbi:hypothetical protein [Halorarum salinum]|uniref:Uncharacterized protein n=1 Tax=Halorarum salinum TaxID=2743089 RepID=A0A7D5QKA2_9EURY|nr:hypothetical protein [Halobaculum salinum]QLG62025.1 hypothetical protein HUG12_09930 [Halobaculum salinum]
MRTLDAEITERKGPALYPTCEVCGAKEGIHKAVVGPKQDDDYHYAKRYELACGHTLHDPDAKFEAGVVTLFQLQHPEYMEIEGENAGN